jgi:hypothetical protein
MQLRRFSREPGGLQGEVATGSGENLLIFELAGDKRARFRHNGIWLGVTIRRDWRSSTRQSSSGVLCKDLC